MIPCNEAVGDYPFDPQEILWESGDSFNGDSGPVEDLVMYPVIELNAEVNGVDRHVLHLFRHESELKSQQKGGYLQGHIEFDPNDADAELDITLQVIAHERVEQNEELAHPTFLHVSKQEWSPEDWCLQFKRKRSAETGKIQLYYVTKQGREVGVNGIEESDPNRLHLGRQKLELTIITPLKGSRGNGIFLEDVLKSRLKLEPTSKKFKEIKSLFTERRANKRTEDNQEKKCEGLSMNMVKLLVQYQRAGSDATFLQQNLSDTICNSKNKETTPLNIKRVHPHIVCNTGESLISIDFHQKISEDVKPKVRLQTSFGEPLDDDKCPGFVSACDQTKVEIRHAGILNLNVPQQSSEVLDFIEQNQLRTVICTYRQDGKTKITYSNAVDIIYKRHGIPDCPVCGVLTVMEEVALPNAGPNQKRRKTIASPPHTKSPGSRTGHHLSSTESSVMSPAGSNGSSRQPWSPSNPSVSLSPQDQKCLQEFEQVLAETLAPNEIAQNPDPLLSSVNVKSPQFIMAVAEPSVEIPDLMDLISTDGSAVQPVVELEGLKTCDEPVAEAEEIQIPDAIGEDRIQRGKENVQQKPSAMWQIVIFVVVMCLAIGTQFFFGKRPK